MKKLLKIQNKIKILLIVPPHITFEHFINPFYNHNFIKSKKILSDQIILIGEYIGSIQTQAMKRPLVIEKERINFD